MSRRSGFFWPSVGSWCCANTRTHSFLKKWDFKLSGGIPNRQGIRWLNTHGWIDGFATKLIESAVGRAQALKNFPNTLQRMQLKRRCRKANCFDAVGISADGRADFLFDAAQQTVNDRPVAADLNQPIAGAELRLVDDCTSFRSRRPNL